MKTKSKLEIRKVVAALSILSAICAPAQSPAVILDDFESGLAKWQATGAWQVTTSRANSPTHSVTDTPGAFYTNNSDTSLTMASAVTLAATPRPALAFRHAYELENQYDSGLVEISTNGGVSWISTPLASYTGRCAAMTREQIDLSSFGTETNAKIRFRMTTDASVVMDGWYLDDVIVGSAPEPIALTAPTGADLGQTWGRRPSP